MTPPTCPDCFGAGIIRDVGIGERCPTCRGAHAATAHIAHVRMTARGYEARCCCGWIGPGRLTMTRAYADLDAHEADHPIVTNAC
jgi:hypothetical protein